MQGAKPPAGGAVVSPEASSILCSPPAEASYDWMSGTRPRSVSRTQDNTLVFPFKKTKRVYFLKRLCKLVQFGNKASSRERFFLYDVIACWPSCTCHHCHRYCCL